MATSFLNSSVHMADKMHHIIQRVALFLLMLSLGTTAVPVATKKPVTAQLATDGQPRITEKRGKFVIRPDTLFAHRAPLILR